MLEQGRGSSGWLDDGAERRQVASQHGDAGVGHERRLAGQDHRVVVNRPVGEVLDEGPAGNRDRLAVEQVLHLGQGGKYAARPVKVVHQELT